MARIIAPLTQMGASVAAREGCLPPLEIRGKRLRPIDYTLPVASAQVKSCVLLAGLYADGETTVREPVRSRNHTEIALREFGAAVRISDRVIAVAGRPRLTSRELTVPADISSAAFYMAAALMSPDAELLIEGVGLNPTRSALIGLLESMGARIEVMNRRQEQGEPTGDILVKNSRLRGGVLDGEMAAQLIDEIPVLAVLGAATEQGLVIRDAAELRVKETDRIATVTQNLRRMGVAVEDAPDGLSVAGRQSFRPARLDSYGDHRIAMAFAVAALRADGECSIERAEAASVSFPAFYDILRQVAE
jgi:3-phosphoshikimate 1-carboxyvinyltransferase